MVPMNHPMKTNWDLLILAMAFYNCFEIPFEIAFDAEFIEETAIQLFNNTTDFCFFLDIVVSFRTTYYDLITGGQVFSGKLTAL